MSILNSIRSQLSPIHPEGYPFIGAFALVSLVLFYIWSPAGWFGKIALVRNANHLVHQPKRSRDLSRRR